MSGLSLQKIQEFILQERFMPLFTHADTDVCRNILQICFDSGIRVFEFTNRSENSYDSFAALKQYRDAKLPGMKIGIGTIKTAKQAEQFIAAGADFLISPLMAEEINEVCKKHKVLWIPGCATPSEIGKAENWGISLVKIFPAKQLGGPAYIKSVKAVFMNMHFMATGGVEPTKTDIQNWFNAGVSVVGIGSQLFPIEMIQHKAYDQISIHIEAIMKDTAFIKADLENKL